MSLGFTLPILFGFLIFHLLRRIPSLAAGWRQACLGTALIAGVFIVAMTEFLSPFHALTPVAVASFWLAGILGVLALRVRLRTLKQAGPSFFDSFRREEPLAKILAVLIGLIAGILGFLALIAVPNSWDGLSYHLPRVAHWQQNRSIAIFATNCMYQNQHCPFAEWSILNLLLLQGRDQLANMVEWCGYAGSILAVSLLTEACGGTRRSGMIAAFLAATLPMAILQATSVQTDEILGFWLLCTAYGCVKVAARPSWAGAFFFAASLGLALLTKALAYLFAPAFCLWIMVALLRHGYKVAIPRLLVIALIALLLNAGYYARNWSTTGTLLGSDADSGPGYRYENETHEPGAIFSNALRNLSLDAPQFPSANRKATAIVLKIHHLLGIDPSDPRTTDYTPYFYIPTMPLDDEVANPLHLLAVAIAFFILLIARKRFTPAAHLLALSVLAGAFLFCFVLKWQPFNSRLHLPLFFLAMPVTAIAFEAGRSRIVSLLLIGAVLVEAAPLILENDSHPLLGASTVFNRPPDIQRFLIRPGDLPAYTDAIRILTKDRARNVGVISPPDNSAWEYPLFAPDTVPFSYPWRLEQVHVANFYASLETKDIPDAVVALIPESQNELVVHGARYHRVFKSNALSVYLK